MSDRKHIKKLREKRVESIGKQVDRYEEKIMSEKGRLDTTKDYWKKEIDEKFLKQIKDDEDYLSGFKEGEENECSD